MRIPRLAFLTAFVICSAVNAQADWTLAAYAGATHTGGNTLRLMQSSGQLLRVGPVAYQGRSWESPIYYGWRVTRWINRPWLGVEAEFTHLKVIADTSQSVSLNGGSREPLSNTLPRFELSHGLNLMLANAVLRKRLTPAPRAATLNARAGLGTTLPHVETSFRGIQRNGYQQSGIAWQVGVGIEWPIVRRLTALTDVRVSQAREHLNLGAGNTLSGAFTSRHLDLGLAWHFGTRE